ncbi:DEAD/DEAH box helicase [Bacillus norwichensis]|uniref:DEAD/DEAH box helicase n=1 Tax=Bacillus norwichensis TaxID=2762217 RepID=UPI001CD82351
MKTTFPLTPVLQRNFSPKLQQFLHGRILLLNEIPFPKEEIDLHIKNGWIEKRPGLSSDSSGWLCHRCHNQIRRFYTTFPCALCRRDCVYCRRCLMMGRVSECTSLYRWIGPPLEWNFGRCLKWDGLLSAGQAAASDAVVAAVRDMKELLIWAVCGAGKTEVLFSGIGEALRLGQRICIATPRTDVVLELVPRIKKVFPSILVAALYGGSDDRHQFSPLMISTTHQLLRFEHAFDTIIVDEVDAFPYTFDESLQWSVKKAAKPKAARIYLTATPSKKWQDECRFGKREFIKIPARFHRRPLPLPRLVWCGNWQNRLGKSQLPYNVLDWAEKRLKRGKQALIFLPHIELMKKSLPILKKLHPAIEAVHAEDPLRKVKVERMRAGETPLLLTTTILERGVTFPNIDVAVLGAEEDIFTEAALVQIAGRVGRSSMYPAGEVTFFHYGRTKAMIQALLHIDGMNKEARKAGQLDE